MDILIHADGTYELYHHGVKGQKWGVRRYQNPDGTLTEAGKKRLYKDVKRAATDRSKQKELADKYSDAIRKSAAPVKELYTKYLNEKFDWNKGSLDYQLDSASQKAADELLGKYANKKISNIHGGKMEAKLLVAQLLNAQGTGEAAVGYDKQLERYRAIDKAADDYKKFTKAEKDLTTEIETGFKQTKYGYDSEINTKIGKDDVVVHVTSEIGNEAVDSINVMNFLKKFDAEKAKEGVAKEYYDGSTSWIDKEPGGDNYYTRDDFKKKMTLMDLELDMKWNTYTAWYDDGGTYGYHMFCVEGSMHDMKSRYMSLQG